MTPSQWRLPVAVGLLALALASTAPAAEKDAPPLRIERITATAATEVLNKPLERAWRGAVERITLKDKLLLSLDIDVTVGWSDKLSRVNVDGKDIRLVTDTGKPCPGLRRSFGRLAEGAPMFYAYRPSNWKDKAKAKPKKYVATFLVPRGTKSAQLTLGNAAPAKVAIPGKVQTPKPPAAPEPGLPAKFVTVQVLEVAVVDQVSGRTRIGREEFKTTIRNPRGKLLRVKLKLTPARGNNDDNPEYFSYNTDHFGLMYGDGVFVLAAGEQFRDYVSAYVSGSLRERNGKWGTADFTLYFAVPAGLKTARLTYQMTPVAGITPAGP